MSELYIPTPNSPDFYECPTAEEFSPVALDHLQWMLANNHVDLETPQGIEYLFSLAASLYSPTDPDHGQMHIRTVKYHSLCLAKNYQISKQEMFALLSSVCLHDVVRCGVNNPAIISAEIAEKVLSLHMRPQTVQMAVDAIAQHSSGLSQRYQNNMVTMLLYEADKSHTDRFRWLLPWGMDPTKYTIIDNHIAPIEIEYEQYLKMVHGSAATSYMSNIIEQRMWELQELKNASE